MLAALTPHQLASGDARPTGGRLAAGAISSSERLAYRGVQFDLALSDASGRSLQISFGHERLDYNRTYTAAGVVARAPASGAPGEQAAHRTVDELLHQAGVEHRSEQVRIERTAITIEGDLSLLRDAFSAEATAQRIFDFATGLGAGIDRGTPAFDRFASTITAGVEQGFSDARALLGELPTVGRDTEDLLARMLERFRVDGQPVRAADLLPG